MLIRSNTLNEAGGITRPSKLFNEPLVTTPIPPATPAVTKPPQNRYEALFIKLFAQTTLQLILSFTAILLSIVIIRDLIGLKIKFLKLSFWFQFTLNLGLLITLIFAKMKCISNVKSNPLSNPFEYFFNQDQLILLGIWTAAAFNFGSWYFRQYAPHIYKLFDQVKGKNSVSPVLREQYFLLWATLLSHGIVSWASSMYFSTNSTIKPNSVASKTSLYNFLKSRVQDVTFWPSLINRSAMIYVTLILIHFTCSWIAFPIFGLFLSALIDLNQPIRHSWTSIFRFGIFAHSLSFSIISNFIFSVIDWLIEFYLGRTFRTSALVLDSEHCLSIGLCQTKQSFIHLQACSEFLEIATESNSFRRYKIFSAVEDEGSLSREILDWFSKELEKVHERSESSTQELNSFNTILGSDRIEIPNPEVFKQYREKTIGLVELILKKIFSVSIEKTKSTEVASVNSSANVNTNGLPEIFARRGPVLNVSEQIQPAKKESIPLIFEFGPFLKKNSIGKLLISNWIASRKIYPIENYEMLQIAIKAIGSFICASFVEDETGQVQLALPRVLETCMKTFQSLQNLLENTFDASEPEIKADEEIEVILNLLREMLKEISDTFGETLENVRISTKCREFIQSL